MKKIANILVIVGALNWGIFGLFDINVVQLIFGEIWKLESIIYILVGISAVIVIVKGGLSGCCCGTCSSSKK